MPSLGNYDRRDFIPVDMKMVDEARLRAEALVQTSQGLLQFDSSSRMRMEDVLHTMIPGDSRSVTLWKMYDNREIALTYEGLRGLYEEARSLAGYRVQKVHAYATELKARIRNNKKVTLSELDLSNW